MFNATFSTISVIWWWSVPLSALFQLYGGGQCHFQHYFSYMVVVSATFSTISVIWWRSVPLSALFQLYGDGQFYWWRKPECKEKTTDLTNKNNIVTVIILQSSKSTQYHAFILQLYITNILPYYI